MVFAVTFRGNIVKTGFKSEDEASRFLVTFRKGVDTGERAKVGIQRLPDPTPVIEGKGFQVTTIDRGGGKVPQTISVVKTFGTRREAEIFIESERREFADRETPVGIRATPTASQEASFQRFQGRQVTGPAPKGRRTTRTPEEEARIRNKAQELARINVRIERGGVSATEKARLIRERESISRTPASEVKIAFGGATKDATPAQIAEAKRTGQDFFVGGERISSREVIPRTQLEGEKARESQKRVSETRAVVSIGADFTEATLDLKPSGAVVGFGSRAVLDKPKEERDMFAPGFVPLRKVSEGETILRSSEEILFQTEKPIGEVQPEPELDFTEKIRRKGLELGFKSKFEDKGLGRKILTGAGAVGLGFVSFFVFAATQPVQFLKGSLQTIIHPIRTAGQIATQFKVAPLVTTGELGAAVVTGKIGGKVTRVVAKKVVQPKMAAISTFKPTKITGTKKTTPLADVQTISTTKKLHPFGKPLSEKALTSLDKTIVTEKKLEITISDTGKVTQKVIEQTKQQPKVFGEPGRVVSGETGAASFTRLGETGDIGKTIFPGLAKEVTKPKGKGKLGELFGGDRQQLFFAEEQVPITQFKLVGLSKLKVIQPSLTKVRLVAGAFAAQKLTRLTGVGAISRQIPVTKAIQTPVTRLTQQPSTKIAQAQLSVTKPISDVKSVTELKPLTSTILRPVISPVIKSVSRLAVRQVTRTELRTIQQLKPFPRTPSSFVFVLPKPLKEREKERKRRLRGLVKRRGTPSLSVVLGFPGKILTKQQLLGQAAISPLQQRALPKRRRKPAKN